MYVVMYISICAAPCGVINDDYPDSRGTPYVKCHSYHGVMNVLYELFAVVIQ